VADPRRFAAALLVVAGIAACDAGPASPPSGSAPMVVRAGTAGPTSPAAAVAPNGLDLLFAKMMLGHHAQAVSMSRTLLAKPGVPERVANIAGFIAHDQQREIDEMSAWLRAWGQDPADPAIARLHGSGGGHGMLTDAQLAEIAGAAPAQATDLYLRYMIEHHRGAVTMARSALDGGVNTYVRGLAKHVINEQTAENDAMGRLLAEPS